MRAGESTTEDEGAPSFAGADPEAGDPFASVAELAALLRAGCATATDLAEMYFERIERLDRGLGAFVSLRREECLAEAARAQERLRAGEAGPLLGVPVVVKDNLDLAGEVTGHGTSANDSVAQRDADAIAALRRAGAPILGRTALPELAAWGHLTESARHGITRNPWDRERTPGGSSGGTAAAVAAGLAPVGLGSDGGGSIRIPAAFCGLFGLKPTRGLISTLPYRDHWQGLTVFGGIGRSVLDVALFDDVLRGASATGESGSGLADAAGREPGVLRVAVSLRGTLPFTRPEEAARGAVAETAELLRSLGHEVAERDPDYGELFTAIMPRYLSGVSEDAEALEDPSRLEPRTRSLARVGRRLRGRPLARALRREARIHERVGALFEDFDVLMTPVTALQPEPAGRWRDKGALSTFNGGGPFVTYTAVWNYLGQPAASVPAGFDAQGMPTAIQLIGPRGADATLVSLAAQLERARPWRGRLPEEA